MAARGPEAAALRALYLSRVAARPGPCADPAIAARARRLLLGPEGLPGPGHSGALDVRAVAERCRRARGDRALRDLVKALELLELLCLNLLLCPWRREIRSLKTFTGNFVYYIQSVLPDDIVKAVLEKIGYVATTATEFSLVKKRNNEETKQTAFEIFLARIECETILEMTSEGKGGNLEEPLQQRTQTQQHRGEQDRDHPPQRGDTENPDKEESSETSLCLALQQNCSAPCPLSFEAAGNVEVKDKLAQAAAAPSTSIALELPRQGVGSARLPGPCSDSEDFLVKYSDIVIGQTPVFSENRSPRAFQTEPRASVSEECALAAEPRGAELGPVPLSPGASGPPAFAMFADSPCDSSAHVEFRASQLPQESIEAEIKDAMNCIDPDPADGPAELKSLPYTDFASAQTVPREEEVCDLSLTFTKLQIKDTQEDLMYPVEETGQPAAAACASASDRHRREFNHSKIKHVYLADAEPSSDLCCTAGNTEHSTTGSDGKRLFMDTGNTHRASEGFRHIREPPNLTYIPPQSIDVQPSQPRRSSTQDRRTLLQPEPDPPESSEVTLENWNSELSENQEPYVIIDRTDQGMLCHHI
ncbi:PREDICTED: uncharacterized protein LOC108505863 [Lepidothrix coronata]|uniref:Uncharacterized protein LOC108505863 n=1 Tax=Lepidothrix coronata TaxID=321398 RepID=A0A6J0IP45_9PASS|nr:PREDICTED: uncharacterized protein LOC108505863 [Lepidothrix coronata]